MIGDFQNRKPSFEIGGGIFLIGQGDSGMGGKEGPTPPRSSALFGKERTWAYRQLYAGKIVAVTEFGRTLIPHSEVEMIAGKAGRYLGAKAKPAKQKNLHPQTHATLPKVKETSLTLSNPSGNGQAPDRRAAVATKWQKP